MRTMPQFAVTRGSLRLEHIWPYMCVVSYNKLLDILNEFTLSTETGGKRRCSVYIEYVKKTSSYLEDTMSCHKKPKGAWTPVSGQKTVPSILELIISIKLGRSKQWHQYRCWIHDPYRDDRVWFMEQRL